MLGHDEVLEKRFGSPGKSWIFQVRKWEPCYLHLPEIGTETGSRKPILVSDAYDMQFGTEFVWYHFLVTTKEIICFHAGLWYSSFLYGFTAPIFGTCLMGISSRCGIERGLSCKARDTRAACLGGVSLEQSLELFLKLSVNPDLASVVV